MGKIEHDGHRQRVKDCFIYEGIDAFSNYQVLEFLLFYAIPHKNTNEMAHLLLDRYGSLSGVFNADYYDLLSVPGIGQHTALLIKLMPALTRRFTRDRWKERTKLTDIQNAGKFVASLYVGYEYEAFYMVCMDSQSRVIMPVLLGEGTVNEAMIYPRLVMENALRHRAVGVILSHNHPSGSLEPSLADIEITKKLAKALDVINVNVMDHIIVAGDKFVSLSEKRLI